MENVETETTADPRTLAHDLVDRLPEPQLHGLVQFLESIVDPVDLALARAPLDDEPESEAEAEAVAGAYESVRANDGKGIPHDQAMRRLGLD